MPPAPDPARNTGLLGHTDQGGRGDGVQVMVAGAPERRYDTRPDRPRVVQSCDVFADRGGVLYVTDDNAGLYVLQFEPGST